MSRTLVVMLGIVCIVSICAFSGNDIIKIVDDKDWGSGAKVTM